MTSPAKPKHIAVELERTSCSVLSYTDREKAIYRFLASTDRRVTTTEVIELIFGAEKHANARIIVGQILRTLRHKLDLNGHPLGLRRSRRFGPHPLFWKLVARSRAETEAAAGAAKMRERRGTPRYRAFA